MQMSMMTTGMIAMCGLILMIWLMPDKEKVSDTATAKLYEIMDWIFNSPPVLLEPSIVAVSSCGRHDA